MNNLSVVIFEAEIIISEENKIKKLTIYRGLSSSRYLQSLECSANYRFQEYFKETHGSLEDYLKGATLNFNDYNIINLDYIENLWGEPSKQRVIEDIKNDWSIQLGLKEPNGKRPFMYIFRELITHKV